MSEYLIIHICFMKIKDLNIHFILQNVKRSPNPHLCSNFQEKKDLKHMLVTVLLPRLFIVMFHKHFGNELTVYQL